MRRCGQWFFNALIGLALVAAYCLIVAGWLIVKTVGNLQFAIASCALGPAKPTFCRRRCSGNSGCHTTYQPVDF